MDNYNSSPTVTRCVFSDNSAGGGSGIFSAGSSLRVINCTFSNNSALAGGGIMTPWGSPKVTNCILRGDNATSGSEVIGWSSAPILKNCDIQGSGGSGALWDGSLGTDGGGDIDADPKFVDAANPAGPDGLWRTGDDGLRLQSGSPCLDAGWADGAPATDILGNPRVGAPDIGAYEGVVKNAVTAWVLYP